MFSAHQFGPAQKEQFLTRIVYSAVCREREILQESEIQLQLHLCLGEARDIEHLPIPKGAAANLERGFG